MTGVAVTAVMVSPVVLLSGAAVLLAVTEHDPPFMSQVATVKSSEYFAMFSKGRRPFGTRRWSHRAEPACWPSRR
jgi:hypothetical protein